MVGYFVDELRMPDGCTVDTDLVGACIEESIYILQLVDAATHGKRDIDFGKAFYEGKIDVEKLGVK